MVRGRLVRDTSAHAVALQIARLKSFPNYWNPSSRLAQLPDHCNFAALSAKGAEAGGADDLDRFVPQKLSRACTLGGVGSSLVQFAQLPLQFWKHRT